MAEVGGVLHAGDWPGRLGTALLGKQAGQVYSPIVPPGMEALHRQEAGVTMTLASSTLILRGTETYSQSP